MIFYLGIIIVFLLLAIAAILGLYLLTVWILSRNSKPNINHYAPVNNYYIALPEKNSSNNAGSELEPSSIRQLKEAVVEICDTAGRGVAAYRRAAGENDSSAAALPMELKSSNN